MNEDLRKQAIEELAKIALANPTDCVECSDGKLEIKADLSADSAAAIAAIERGPGGIKLRFHDKLKALEMLLESCGPETSNEGSNLLQAILDATSKPADLSDIPELKI